MPDNVPRASARNLHGIAMVRNEADVVEVFVRHNLTILDRLTIVDHGSSDCTPSVLAALLREGLPLEVIAETSEAFSQSEVVTREVRRIFSTTEADFIFLLDADEFLKVRSRARLVAALESIPSGMYAVQGWHTYVPDFSRPLDPVEIVRSARKVMPAGIGYKAIVTRCFIESTMYVADGNHYLRKRLGNMGDFDVEPFRLRPEDSALAHVPVRSGAQFSVKVLVRWLARLIEPERHRLLGRQWLKAYDDLFEDKVVTPDMLARATLPPGKLTELAMTYGLTKAERMAGPLRLVDEPFLADVRIAYPDLARADPLALVPQIVRRLETLAKGAI
jgi:glycosyl transferase family 2